MRWRTSRWARASTPRRPGRCCGDASREALARAGAAPADVLGVAATSMRHGSVLLDAQGARAARDTQSRRARPRRRARTRRSSTAMRCTGGPDTGRTRYSPPGDCSGSRATTAARLERATRHLSLSDWIGFQLCGVAAAEPSQAAETLLFELEQPRWAWDWIERLGLPRRLFPEVRAAGTRLGALTPAAADASDSRPASRWRSAAPTRSAVCSVRASSRPARSA